MTTRWSAQPGSRWLSGPEAATARWLCGLGLTIVAVGTLLPALGSLAADGMSPASAVFVVVLLAWSALPYAVVWLASSAWRDPWVATFAALFLVVADLWIRIEVFFVPRGSTAALVFLVTPLYGLLAILPAGALFGWLWGRLWRRGGGFRVGAVFGLALFAVLALVARARPAWLPSSLARAVSAEQRIGPARVVRGADAFESRRLSDRRAWYQTGEFDAAPGEELLAVERESVWLLAGEGVERVPWLPLSSAASGRWNWYSELAFVGGSWAIVQTGGGYSDVEVVDLDGTARWSFLAERSPPPVALLPRDLDRDGRTEFYAAAGEILYRLDESGGIVWQREVGALVDHLDAARSDGTDDGIVLVTGGGGAASLWAPRGERLGELELPPAAYRQGLVRWGDGLALVGGQEEVSVRDLSGRVLLTQPLGDFVLANAESFRLQPSSAPLLAVAAAAGRGVERHRLMVLTSRGELLYDEVLATPVRALVRRGAPGLPDQLLLPGDGLRHLAPRGGLLASVGSGERGPIFGAEGALARAHRRGASWLRGYTAAASGPAAPFGGGVLSVSWPVIASGGGPDGGPAALIPEARAWRREP